MCVIVLNSRLQMSINSQKKQSDLEKRFKQMQSQFYGKETLKLSPSNFVIPENLKSVPSSKNLNFVSSDLEFLYRDLTKIFILSMMAFGIQIVIFYLFQNNILRVSYFF